MHVRVCDTRARVLDSLFLPSLAEQSSGGMATRSVGEQPRWAR